MPWSTSDRASRLPDNWKTKVHPDILIRDGHRCKIKGPGCQVVATEVDHIKRGDNHAYSNLQAACERCHAKKSAREGNEVKARMRALRFRPEGKHPGLR